MDKYYKANQEIFSLIRHIDEKWKKQSVFVNCYGHTKFIISPSLFYSLSLSEIENN